MARFSLSESECADFTVVVIELVKYITNTVQLTKKTKNLVD